MASSSIPKARTASFSLHIATSNAGHGYGYGYGAAASSTANTATGSPAGAGIGRVPLDSRVILSRRRSGYVRYVGKLKNEAGEWYGVALDEAKGEHDGAWQGEHYFECAPQHGVFVRRKEIFYVKEQPSSAKAPPSPVMHDASDEGSGSSNASMSSLETTEGGPSLLASLASSSKPAPSPTMSPLERTFKTFRRALQSPMKVIESTALSSSAAIAGKLKEPSPRKSMRASMSMTTTPSIAAATVQSSTARPHEQDQAANNDRFMSASSHPQPSIFDDDEGFGAMTRALAQPNNDAPIQIAPLAVPQPPPQIADVALDASSASMSQLRRPSTDRRHSTFAYGASAATSAAASNYARIVDLEKEMLTMRTNHENVVAVLRATNKQHAANVLELRAQVSALADGNSWLQKQLSSKSALLAELRVTDRDVVIERDQLRAQSAAKDATIQDCEHEIATLKSKVVKMEGEKQSLLVQLQQEFRAKQQRDREQIQKLREDVVSMCNERTSLQCELQDMKEMSFLF